MWQKNLPINTKRLNLFVSRKSHRINYRNAYMANTIARICRSKAVMFLHCTVGTSLLFSLVYDGIEDIRSLKQANSELAAKQAEIKSLEQKIANASSWKITQHNATENHTNILMCRGITAS